MASLPVGAADRLWLYADGVKLSNRTVDQRLDAGIAWIHRRMQIEHAYDRLVPVAIFEVDGTELSPSWRASVTIGDNARAFIESLVQFQLLWFLRRTATWATAAFARARRRIAFMPPKPRPCAGRPKPVPP
jgi:hypothetical protein